MRGRPVDPIRREIADDYGVPFERIRRLLPDKLEQLKACQSKEAVRLLLGISRKKKAHEGKRHA